MPNPKLSLVVLYILFRLHPEVYQNQYIGYIDRKFQNESAGARTDELDLRRAQDSAGMEFTP
jgi:hypothetical protein